MATHIITVGGENVDPLAVVDLSEKANQAILEVYSQNTENWGIELKDENEPVTRADKAANTVICEGLKRLAPSIPIISEENAQIPFDVRSSYEYYWMVDPLDGTKEFLKRNGQFTVNIALCRKQKAILGVVTVPCDGTAYLGVEGQGAFKRNSKDSSFHRITAASFSMGDSQLTIVGSRSHHSEQSEEFMKQFKQPKFTSLGSSLKLLLIAEGSAHVYPRLFPTREWDTCAAHAIVSEAGGEVLQMEGGQPACEGKEVVYNKPNLLNPFFVVYGKRTSS